MNETMVANWNSAVSDNDIIYHLGDFAFEKDRTKLETLMSRLNGEKHIIWGNHDNVLKSVKWRDHFKTSSDLRTIVIPAESNNGVMQRIVLCHFAFLTWDQAHYDTIHLHGHSHGTLPDDPYARRLDVGVDCWNFTPVSMEQINEKMKEKLCRPKYHRQGNTENGSEAA